MLHYIVELSLYRSF